MITYTKFKKTNIDLAPLGFEQNENFVPYYCTPKNANILASAGVDGITLNTSILPELEYILTPIPYIFDVIDVVKSSKSF